MAKVDGKVEKEFEVYKAEENVDWGLNLSATEDGVKERKSSASVFSCGDEDHHLSAPSSPSSTHTAVPFPAFSSTYPNSKELPAAILPHPLKASGLQSRYLAAISASLLETDGKEVSEAWEVCLKYLDGENALEKIAVREGWKRKRVEMLRGIWKQRGVLVEARGW